MFTDSLATELFQLKQNNLYRQQKLLTSAQGAWVEVDGQRLVNFSSNDYLGLANHPKIKAAFKNAVDEYGVGSGASHLISGHSKAHQQLEQVLCEWLERPRALLFSSGYLANCAVISGLLNRHDAIFQDKLSHASLIDGAKLSSAHLYRFQHNDVSHLNELLANSSAVGKESKKIIATEGIFSMDGDAAPLKELSQLADQYKAALLIDDAHGLGCSGIEGRGSIALAGLTAAQAPLLMGTLGKALGTSGAFIAGDETLIEYLLQKARPYIYTTALPPAIAVATSAAIAIVRTENWRREKLTEHIYFFRERAKKLGLKLANSQSAIQPLFLGNEKLGDVELTLTVGEKLFAQGFWVSAIRPPTVPQGSARLRISLSAEHTREQLQDLLVALEKSL